MANSPEEQYKVAEGLSQPDKPHVGSGNRPDDSYMEERDEENRILNAMRRNVEDSVSFWDEIYLKARDDLDFAYYEQWQPAARREREDKRRPVLSLNLLPQYINRITGAQRQSKFGIHVQQVGGPSMVGITSSGMELPFSEVMEGLIRDIEAKSKASMEYSRAFQHAVEGSIGWLEVSTETSPHDPFNAEIRIKNVKDRYAVIIDHLAEQANFQDANYAIIGKYMNLDDFKKKYPEIADRPGGSLDISRTTQSGRMHWYTNNAILIGKYYWKEPVKRTYVRMMNMESGEELIVDKKKHKQILDELELLGYQKQQEKTIDSWQVKVALVTEKDILEGPFDWPGMTIPIVPVTGRQVDTDYGTDYLSVHRYAKDSQMMFNYASSAAIERVANAPKAQWLATVNAVKGVEGMWTDQHVNTRDLLLYKFKADEPPPARIAGAEIPQAEIALTQMTHSTLMDNIGMHESSIGAKSNETSGKAIENRQIAGEYGTTEFIDNLNYSISTVGDVICDILPSVYSNVKMRRLMLADDTQVDIILNKKIVDRKSGTEHTINNLGLARFSSNSIAGPSFTSQRQEFAHFLTEMAKANPQVLGVMPDLLVKSLGMPESSTMERRLKFLVPRHMLTPEEQKDVPEPQPTPEQQVEMAKSQGEMAKAQSVGQVAQISVQGETTKQELEIQMHQLRVEQEKIQLEQEKVKLAREQNQAVADDMQADREESMMDKENKKKELEESSKEREGKEKDDEKSEKKMKQVAKQTLAEDKAKQKSKEQK